MTQHPLLRAWSVLADLFTIHFRSVTNLIFGVDELIQFVSDRVLSLDFGTG